MDYISEINAIEARSRALGLSLTDLCLRSGVRMSNISRWKNRKANPTIKAWSDARDRLMAFLDRQEAAQ